MPPVCEAEYFSFYHCGFLFAGWWGIKFQAQNDQVYTQKTNFEKRNPKKTNFLKRRLSWKCWWKSGLIMNYSRSKKISCN